MKELYQNRIVAFIDILGFANIVKDLHVNPVLFEKLNYALNRIKSVELSNQRPDGMQNPVEVSVFSDSIVLSTDIYNLGSLIWTAGWLQAQLMYVGIFVRGGIAIGPTIHQNGILFGDGMLSAYRLESKSAIYPRIIISKKLDSYISQNDKQYIMLDFDFFNYINPFKFEAVPGNAEEMAANGYNPRTDYFNKVGVHIQNNLNNFAEEDHWAKYRWLGHKFNYEVQSYNQSVPETVPLAIFT